MIETPDVATSLADRFLSVLSGIGDRQLDVDALFEVLKLEVLDWQLDNDLPIDSGPEKLAALAHTPRR